MFVSMALLLLLLSLPSLWHRPPPRDAGDGRTAEPLRITLARIRQRLRAPGALAFIGLIAVYKFGDSMGSAMVGPFLHDLGLSKQAIAVLKGTLGSGAALAGAALGGWLVYRLGRRAALLGLGLAQTLSLLPYGLAALGIGGTPLLWTACIGEHLFGSMATVALFALMMDAADPDHAGSDYSLYACAIVFVQGAAGLAAGVVGDLGGYPLLFALSALLSALGCGALVRGFDRGRGPSRVATVWKS
jgi:predicted MFS family arabinose efflux permease